jgi:hypothetical protein
MKSVSQIVTSTDDLKSSLKVLTSPPASSSIFNETADKLKSQMLLEEQKQNRTYIISSRNSAQLSQMSPKSPSRDGLLLRDFPNQNRPISRPTSKINMLNGQSASFGQIPRDSSGYRSSRGSGISPILFGNPGGLTNGSDEDSIKSAGSYRASVAAAALARMFNQSAAAVLETNMTDKGKMPDQGGKKAKRTFFGKLFK